MRIHRCAEAAQVAQYGHVAIGCGNVRNRGVLVALMSVELGCGTRALAVQTCNSQTSHPSSQPQSQSVLNTHTHTHARTHTHTHARTHARTHAHTPASKHWRSYRPRVGRESSPSPFARPVHRIIREKANFRIGCVFNTRLGHTKKHSRQTSMDGATPTRRCGQFHSCNETGL